MKQSMNIDPKHLPTVNNPDFIWAKEKLNDILFGCILNIKLYQSGICEKLILNMDNDDINKYNKILQTIHLSK